MKRLLLAVVAIFGLGHAYPSVAQIQGVYQYQNVGFCRMTSLGSATPVATANCTTGSVPGNTNNMIAQICVEGAAVRYRDDGSNPTATIGVPVTVGSCFQYSGWIPALSFIQQTSGAIIEMSFYK